MKPYFGPCGSVGRRLLLPVTWGTFTDFAEGEDTVDFNYYGSNGAYYDKAAFVTRFDANLDGAISRADGSARSSSMGESYSFSGTGLTLAFDDARLTLRGADYLI